MRITMLSLTVLLSSAAVGSAAAQSPASPSKPADKQNPSAAIERWIAGPTPITLNTDQQKKFDSLKVRYAVESPARDTGEDMMTRIQKIQSLQARYRKAIREMLTPAQQVTFDKNVEATNVRR